MMTHGVLPFVLSCALLGASCSAPESGTPHAANDVPDEPSDAKPAVTTVLKTGAGPGSSLPDKMRGLDKNVYKLSVADLPAIGSANALLTIVLFSDYECPYCRKLDPALAKLHAELGEEARIVLAPRPLSFHKRARPAAEALIAASVQGRTKEMHERLVALDGKLDDASIENAAKDAGLDMARFEADRHGPVVERVLARSEALAKHFKVDGTPTVFMNGRRIVGAMPDVSLQLADEQLAAARALVTSGGAPRSRVYESIVARGLEKAESNMLQRDRRLDEIAKRLPELRKCFSASDQAPDAKVTLAVDATGAVTEVAVSPTSPAAECAEKTVKQWTFDKGDGQMRIVLPLASSE